MEISLMKWPMAAILNGYDVFLMRNLADNVAFSDNGATVEMVFKMA